MWRRCAWSGLDMGRKEPFENPERTDGICPACAEQVRQGAAAAPLPPQSWPEMLLEVRAVAQRIEARVEKLLAQK
jgi:hypothetical protein